MDYLEILGTAVGLLYLYWEYKANPWLWGASIAMPVIYLFVYWHAGLYADFALSVYYILASLYGVSCWAGWLHNRREEPQISFAPSRLWPRLVAIGIPMFLAIGIALSRWTDSTVPWADSFTTSLSIVAMWMLAKKYVEQWYLWIAADVACALLYAYKDLPFTAGLYAAYAVVAIFGYRKWREMMNNQERRSPRGAR